MPRTADPFVHVVDPTRLNPTFVLLKDAPGFRPARGIIREIFGGFDDIDGNFVEQFQTTGFDARIWELYLYQYLRSAGFDLDRRHPHPDFVATARGTTVCIEAVTVNPSQGGTPVAPLARREDDASIDDIRDSQRNRFPIKLGSALTSKLRKRYWELPHVAGRP